MRKRYHRLLPKSFLWRLTLVNIVVITAAIMLTGWAVYETACILVGGIGNFTFTRQQQFNKTLFQYLFLFTGIAVFISTVFHFYITRKLISPINQLIEATKMLSQGTYPEPLPLTGHDEIGKLVSHYNDLLDQLQKNEAQRKKLVDDVSHELRTPIANLSGYLHALKSGDIEGDKELFAALHEQTERLTLLMEQIEHLNEWNAQVAHQTKKKEIVQIKDVITQAVQMFSWEIERSGLSIQMEVERANCLIYKEGMQQVLTNLIDNAIRYYVGSGPISIIGKKENSSYSVSVTSPGEKIQEEDQRHLFERFYRIEQSRNRNSGGSGLGLAIANEIVGNHGGIIEVESLAGKNTFVCTFPMEHHHPN